MHQDDELFPELDLSSEPVVLEVVDLEVDELPTAHSFASTSSISSLSTVSSASCPGSSASSAGCVSSMG